MAVADSGRWELRPREGRLHLENKREEHPVPVRCDTLREGLWVPGEGPEDRPDSDRGREERGGVHEVNI